MHAESIYLAVNLFDRVMSRHCFSPRKLQGLMCTCLLLACKVRARVYAPPLWLLAPLIYVLLLFCSVRRGHLFLR